MAQLPTILPDLQPAVLIKLAESIDEISFWDAMVMRSAAQLGCRMLWSEDLNSGQVYEGVRVMNPFAEPEKG